MTEVKEGTFDHIDVPRGLSLRLATSTDVDDIKRLDDLAFGAQHGITVDEIHALIEHGAIILLCTDPGEIIGETQVLLNDIPQLPYTIANDEAYYYGTAHHPGPEWTGQGLGSALAAAQEAFARSKGAKRASLTVRIENYPSLRLRFRSGFRVVRYIPDFYGKGLTNARLFMTKSFHVPASEEFDNVRRLRVVFGDEPDPVAHTHAIDLLGSGYVGVAAERLGRSERTGVIKFVK